MKSLKKLVFLSALLSLLSIGTAYGADVAERGGGGIRGGGIQDRAGFDNRAGELRRDDAYENIEGGIDGGIYGYPVGGYLENTNPFPDGAAEDAIYKENQHSGE